MSARPGGGATTVVASGSLELWGGLECTVARIGDRVRDQVRETGHQDRPDDLDRLAALGIRTLRYPVLWERVEPGAARGEGWAWHDARLRRLRELGIRPIVGLIHHGSGPVGTDLLARDFPRRLARHAERVARRYPWVDHYTPVNEPLTTARFSGLYGHWYPHGRGYGEFLRALVNQCRATLLAMRAIRRVNPGAQLIQTDDFGRTFSTPALAYQAEHENERRWLTFDLLFGRVDRHHPWRRILRDHGVPERDLDAFRDGEARPDVVGINHYLTSERFLDGRLERYPAHLVGGNGRERYADVEAVRVRTASGQVGPGPRLREVWDRYQAPIAVTEVHHGCTRDEQLRWLAEVWRAADAERQAGADIRAVTAWALFGTMDWNSLLTREAGIYEPGAFDIRGPAPRPTALATAVGALARTGSFDHPVLDRPGWWRRETRFYHPGRGALAEAGDTGPRRILLAGPGGPLRRALERVAAARGLALAEPSSALPTAAELDAARIWAVIDVSADADEPGSPGAGAASSGRWAALCRESDRPFLTVRPGLVTPPLPRGQALDAPGTLLVRTGPLYGPWERDAFVAPMLGDIATRRPLVVDPSWLAPVYLPDLVHVALDLLIDGESGVWDLGNPPFRSMLAFARELAGRVGEGRPAVILPSRSAEPAPVARASRGELLPDGPGALERYLRDCEFDWRLPAGHLPAAAE